MQTTEQYEPLTDPHQGPSRYRIVEHKEAGVFDSLTGATLWALKNLKDWNWRIEPVPGRIRHRRRSTPKNEANNKTVH